MKFKILLALVLIFGFSAGTAMAQDPTATLDTVVMVPTVVPDPGTAQDKLVLELYVYSDEALTGATAGFNWDNPNVQMDSAVATATATGGFDLGVFMYEDFSLATTNANQRFLFGGASLFGQLPGDASGRRHWATYYFTVSDIANFTSVTFDTGQFNAGSEWLFVSADQANFDPTWPFGTTGLTIGEEPPAANLVLDPTALSFTAVEGGANPAGQTFGVASDGDPLAFTVTAPEAWLSAAPASGTTPETITASVDITGLTPGTYNGTVQVASAEAANSPQEVAVTLTVEPAPINLVVDPATLQFEAVEGEGNPADQSFTVSTDGDPVNFSVSSLQPWLTLDPTSGTTPLGITASVDIASLPAGTYYDTIQVISAQAANSPQFVYVTLVVNEPPVLLATSPDTLSYTAVAGGANPDAQFFAVTEVGGRSIPYSVTENSTWIMTDKVDGTTPDSVGVMLDITGVPAGNYLDSIVVSSVEATNPAQVVYIDLTVDPAPVVLAVTPDTLFFTATEGGPATDGQFFYVSEASGQNVPFDVVGANEWIHLGITSGTTPDSVMVTVVPGSLATGDHWFTVEVQSAGADNSPQEVVVAITINPAMRRLVATPDSLVFTGIVDGAAPQAQIFTVTEAGGDPTLYLATETSDWFSVTPGGGTTPNSDTVAVDITGLAAGTYVDTILIIGNEELLPVNGDSVKVVLILTPPENQPPVLDSIGPKVVTEGLPLNFEVTASDPDGTFPSLDVYDLPTGASFVDSGSGTGYFSWMPDFEQAGDYELIFRASDGEFIDSELVMITVLDSVIPCNNLLLSDTVFTFHDTVDFTEGPFGFSTLNISSSDAQICFTIDNAFDTTLPGWVRVVPMEGCTPAEVQVGYDATGLGEGQYSATLMVLGDENTCDPGMRYFTLVLNLVDTTGPPPVDTMAVATVPTVPGAHVIVPVTFTNSCDLYQANLLLAWTSEYLTLDSVTFGESRVQNFTTRIVGIDNDLNEVGFLVQDSLNPLSPGFGNFADLHFRLAPEAPPGFYEIFAAPPILDFNPTYLVNCGGGLVQSAPDFLPGGVVTDTTAQFVCGYVVDTAGNAIEGAMVEMWSDFPTLGPDMMTPSDTSGYFEFRDFVSPTFDLYAYKEGYYPGLVEEVEFGETGIMIVLTPVAPVYWTYEWVDFYCDQNLYFGAPLPVGSVIDAYDPDGVRCGTWFVSEAGKYGFMPVYRDDPYMEGDQGAEPGDQIRFFVNGVEAEAYGDRIWTQNGDSWQVCLEAGEFTQSCDLMAGWNLVSWRVDTESDYILDAMTSIANHIELVLGFEQGGLTYDPNLPQFSTLWNVDHLSGYWIKVDSNVTLEITGAAVAESTPIPVTAGWNLVSYLPDFNLETPVALQSIHDDLIVALGFDGGGQVYLPGDDLHNTLNLMGPCNGYWVKVMAAGQLIYPADGPILFAQSPRPLGNAAAKTAAGISPTTRWMNLYAHNLTLDDEVVRAGATVEAYSEAGIKVGSFTLTQDGLFGFMPVYADDRTTTDIEGVQPGEKFSLVVDGQATTEMFSFGAHGDQVEITSLTASGSGPEPLPTSFSLAQNYPNPFNPTTTIQFSLPEAGKARIEIYNVLGELVAVPFDGVARAGENSISWDATNSGGQRVASGIYFYRLTADNFTETKKMTLMK